MDIDVNFDFTNDTTGYWSNYWGNDYIFGRSNVDPDLSCKTLFIFHEQLYSRRLPNGDNLVINYSKDKNCLVGNGIRFGNDSIATSFRSSRYANLIGAVASEIDDFKSYIENYVHKSYTLGGEIIFPKMVGSINQMRGCNPYIRDRWDLTLECIRRYYKNEESPLFTTLKNNDGFFKLFVDFKGYVDYFFLQDYVSEDYNEVKFLIETNCFETDPVPKNVQEYCTWIDKTIELIARRNKRIKDYLEQKQNPLD